MFATIQSDFILINLYYTRETKVFTQKLDRNSVKSIKKIWWYFWAPVTRKYDMSEAIKNTSPSNKQPSDYVLSYL